MRLEFASDNVSGIAPEALEGLIAANTGFVSSYGVDAYVARAGDLLRALLDADVEVHFVASGTAANALCLATAGQPFESVVAHAHAHVFTEETGALAWFGHGLGSTAVSATSGLIDPHALQVLLNSPETVSSQAPAVLSISNPTEYGTVYDTERIRVLTGIAKAHGLATHCDGARLCNAAAADFELSTLGLFGIDLLVVGGSKSGMPPTEAVAIFNGGFSRRFRMRLKQAGQLPSKARCLAAPWIGMLESGAWVERARHANAMAQRLAALTPFPLAHPVQTNAVFVRMTGEEHARLLEAGWQVFRFADGSVRLMCSWATTEEQVEEFGVVLESIA